MLNMCKGSRVPFPEKLFPGYEQEGNHLYANVNAEDILTVMRSFIAAHREPLFFILELPTNIKDESFVRPGVVEQFHKDVYYMDGCTQEEALEVLSRVGKLLVHDGMSAFGFGGHKSGDEIMKEKYNMVTVLSRNISACKDTFAAVGISEVEELITAWDTFSQENPGESCSYEIDGKSVYDIPGIFKDRGMYKAERREA